MSAMIVVLILGLAFIRAISVGGRRRWHYAHSVQLEEKVTRLEALVTDLQEQLERDREAITRLQDERDFLKQLYPAQAEQKAS